MKKYIILFIIALLSACSPPAGDLDQPSASTPFQQPTPSSPDLTPTRIMAEPTGTTVNTPQVPETIDNQPIELTSTPIQMACSPLQDVPLEELEEYVVNPFNPPRLGSDEPHQGIDLAILTARDQIALSGAPVQAVLSGRVAALIQDRFPYGNGILIETELDNLGTQWSGFHQLPTPAPTLPPHPSLTCPTTGELGGWDQGVRSLYLLYAHLQSPPEYQVGEIVSCGEVIGAIGQSGNALNPHLHLELRIGPAGASFPGIAHYETRATPVEMEAYCIWRVSGLFQLLDPLNFFISIPDR